jgi:hypothetical protein
LDCIVLYCIVLYCIVLYCIVLYCIVLYCIVLYCIVLYCNSRAARSLTTPQHHVCSLFVGDRVFSLWQTAGMEWTACLFETPVSPWLFCLCYFV